MDFKATILRILVIILLLSSNCSGIRVRPCPTNKIAPHRRPHDKTFGLLWGSRPTGVSGDPGSDCGPVSSNPDDNPALVTIDSDNDNQDVDYDPVNSEENTDNNYQNSRPPQNQRPQNGNNFGGFLNWWPSVITPDNWPSRPPRPPPPIPPTRPPYNNWFWNWFRPPNRPSKPPRPPYDDITKPVYEHIEDDYESTTWRPGLIVGGPNNDIIGVTQDLSNWSTVPTPRPTRPFIPGQREPIGPTHKNNRRGSQTIIGSFIDLLFKK